MKNSTLLMAALMAVTASAVKAQALNTTLKQKLGAKHASVVMKPNAPAIYTLPGTKGLTTSRFANNDILTARRTATMQRLKARAMKKARAAADAKVWLPSQQTSYVINEDTGDWDLDTKYSFKYNDKAQMCQQFQESTSTEGGITNKEYYRVDLTYDNNGKWNKQEVYSSLDGTEYTGYKKTERTYDAIQPNLLTYYALSSWNELSKKWELSSQANKYVYTRDADNNILSMEISQPYQGEWETIVRSTNTIDPATKQVNSFKYEKLDYNDFDELEWEVDQYYKNLKWKETNGQVAKEYESDPQTNWMSYGNYLLSATICDETGADNGTLTLTYTPDGGYDENKVYTFNDIEDNGQPYSVLCKEQYTVTYTDDNGSFDIEYKLYGDFDGDEKFTDNEIASAFVEVVKYDEHDNLTADLGYEMPEPEGGDEGDDDDYDSYAKQSVFDVTAPATDTENIDATNMLTYKGYPLTQGGLTIFTYDAAHNGAEAKQVSYEYDMASFFMPVSKIETTAYADVTTAGIHNVTSASNAAPAVYTLQGIKVGTSLDKAPRGTYIVKSGDKVVKVRK
jgi:hypothetical protein